MRIKLEQTQDLELVKNIMTHRDLFLASMTDEDIELYKRNEWEPDDKFFYLHAFVGDKNIGIIRFSFITSITVDVHYHILPQFWREGVSGVIDQKLSNWLKDNTQVHKICIQTPQTCSHVLKASMREGYEVEGILTGAIYWRGEVTNLCLLAKFIDRRV